jgi:hypothetical protein
MRHIICGITCGIIIYYQCGILYAACGIIIINYYQCGILYAALLYAMWWHVLLACRALAFELLLACQTYLPVWCFHGLAFVCGRACGASAVPWFWLCVGVRPLDVV